jgi:uncharacterized membrane protein
MLARLSGSSGSLLLLLGIILLVFTHRLIFIIIDSVLVAAGLILVLIALKHVSKIAKDSKIFIYGLISAVFGLAGYLILVAPTIFPRYMIIVDGEIPILKLILWMSIKPDAELATLPLWWQLYQYELIAIWITLIISSLFVKLSYDRISRSLGIGLFSTTALLYLVGAALTITTSGVPVIMASLITQAIAFIKIRSHQTNLTAAGGKGKASEF